MKRGTFMVKKERDRLAKLVGSFLSDRGATATGGFYELHVETRAGRLLVHLDRSMGAILCCFEEPARAASILSRYGFATFNSYSGKWNYHFDRCTAEQAFLIFANGFSRVACEVQS